MKVDTWIGWMLLRDGHAVPIRGLDPEQLKQSARATIAREGVRLRHQARLNAIVDCLGFDGDFGDYCGRHWPRVQALMNAHGLREYRDLFSVGVNDLGFGLAGPRRRLADRLTVPRTKPPKRVFLGGGHPWEEWDRYFADGPSWWRADDADFVPADVETTRKWVHQRRFMMTPAAHTYLGDQWLDVENPGDPVFISYRTADAGPPSPSNDLRNAAKVVRACRWVLDQGPEGWVEIIPVTDRLFLLKGLGGAYDFVWANLRTAPPAPLQDTSEEPLLHQLDLPSLMQQQENFAAWNYYRLDVWEEKEQHEAETLHYVSGGAAGADYPGIEAILERYLRRLNIFRDKAPFAGGRTVPSGFRETASPDGGRVLVSELVTIDEMRRMMSLTSYAARRPTGLDQWEPGNGDDLGSMPTAATWFDTQAYCAWMERQLGCQVRLPSTEEYRAWFPEPDFDDIREPQQARSGVEKLEPWGGVRGQPERVRFAPALPWVTCPAGVKAIAAFDVLEWVQYRAGVAVNPAGTFGCAPSTWGAYKGLKVLFRLVIVPEGGR